MPKRRMNGEGTIRQRADGRWEGMLSIGFDAEGHPKRRSVYGSTQKECRQKMLALSHDFAVGTYVEPSKLTVEEWLTRWTMEYLESVKASTRESYDYQCRVNIIPWIGSIRIQKLKAENIQHLYSLLMKDHTISYKSKNGEKETSTFKSLSPKSIRNLNGCIHKAMKQAVALGIIQHNPCEAVSLPRVEKKEIEPLEGLYIPRFLQVITGKPYEYVFKVAMFTGMRQSEIIGLSWDCVDFKRKEIRIEKQLRRVRRTDGTKEEYEFTSLKTKQSRRIIRPADAVFDILKTVQLQQKKDRLQYGQSFDNVYNLVFTNEIGHHLYAVTLLKEFKKRVREIGLPTMRFHDLRHTFATLSLQNGDDIKTVSQNLGHANISTTADVYAHVTDEMQRRSADRMQAFIDNCGQTVVK